MKTKKSTKIMMMHYWKLVFRSFLFLGALILYIYNWDFAMMFTPLIFVNTLFAKSLVFLSLALLIRWEYLVHRHPEYFSEKTNRSLSCSECPEKLCHHKKQLKSFWKRQKKLS